MATLHSLPRVHEVLDIAPTLNQSRSTSYGTHRNARYLKGNGWFCFSISKRIAYQFRETFSYVLCKFDFNSLIVLRKLLYWKCIYQLWVSGMYKMFYV